MHGEEMLFIHITYKYVLTPQVKQKFIFRTRPSQNRTPRIASQ